MSPFCHFRRPNFFPKPEKVSEAWLAVLSMVSWVVWGRKERSVEGGTLGNHSHARLASTGAPSPEAMRTEGLQRRQCWVEYGGVLGYPPSCPPAPPDLSALLLWPDPPLAEPLFRPMSLEQRDVGFSSSDTTNHRGSTCQPHLFSRVDCPTCPRMDAIKVKSFDQGYSVSEGHGPFPGLQGIILVYL